MSEFREEFGEIVNNLFAIEVNTIVKANMTATRMRNAAHTFLDVAFDYHEALTRLNARPRSAGAAANRDIVLEFTDLRERGKDRLVAMEERKGGAPMSTEMEIDYLLLCRIIDNCDLIKGMFDALRQRGETLPTDLSRSTATGTKLELTASERLQLRKIWEVGTETVVMQTVIHLDGDVFTRLQAHAARQESDSLRVIDLHNRGIGTAAAFWKTLAELVGTFFQTLFPLMKQGK